VTVSNSAWGNGLSTTVDSTSISHLDSLFTVPAQIILTKQKIAASYPDDAAVSAAILATRVDDHAIAAQLMVECSLRKHSLVYPYLMILPKSVPNLQTFNDDELALFQSDVIHSNGLNMRMQTVASYNTLAPTITEMARVAAANAGVPLTATDATCLSEESFAHYASVVGSRAMVLQGTKHLTPLADMANYSPNSNSRAASGGTDFLTYHVLGDDGSMTVKSDRDVAGSLRHGGPQQIFEDYGDNSNSIYIEAHGFVPDVNPFNCGEIPNPVVDSDAVLAILKNLKIVQDTASLLDAHLSSPNACVTADLSIAANSREYAYYAVVALQSRPQKLEYCQAMSMNRETRGEACIRYGGNVNAVTELLKEVAVAAIAKFPTDKTHDEALLASGELSERGELAVKYRLAQKEVLAEAAKETVKSKVSGERRVNKCAR